jgi:hypothetical protein
LPSTGESSELDKVHPQHCERTRCHQ